MKGLIRKDLYMLWKYMKAMLIAVGVFAVLSFAGNNDNLILTIYPGIITGMLPMTLLTYDEMEHFCPWCDSLPVTRKDYVTAKYLVALPHGMFAGLRPAFRQVTSSYETLTKYDHTIECFGDGTTINLSLPSSPEVGQCYEIWKWGTCTVYVRSDSKTIARLGVATNLDTLGLDPSYIGVIKLVYDGTKWLATLHRTE